MDRDIRSCRACHGGWDSYVEIFEAISLVMEQPKLGFISKVYAIVVGNLFMLHMCNYVDRVVIEFPIIAVRYSRLDMMSRLS